MNKKPELISYYKYSVNDSNEKQCLDIDLECRTLKLTMKSFYDLYGRVIIYDLKVF